MGLDMYLSSLPKVKSFDQMLELDIAARRGDLSRKERGLVEPYIEDTCEINRWAKLSQEEVYWRKVDQIHRWFVENILEENNCCPKEVKKSDIVYLKKLCEEVLETPDKASELLPVIPGIYGQQDYKEWYFEGLKYTVEKLGELLEKFDFEERYLYYHSSW